MDAVRDKLGSMKLESVAQGNAGMLKKVSETTSVADAVAVRPAVAACCLGCRDECFALVCPCHSLHDSIGWRRDAPAGIRRTAMGFQCHVSRGDMPWSTAAHLALSSRWRQVAG